MDALVKGRNNNFNLVRFCAASMVIIGHAFVITHGTDFISPFHDFWGIAADKLAVNVFFILSGFLVTKSILTRSNAIDYSLARILRVFPGIMVMSVVIALGLGLAVTTLPASQYLLDWQTFKFVLITSLTTLDIVDLPGVFANNVYANKINLPLWTIKYELTAYVCLLGLWFVGVLQRRNYFNVVSTLFLLTYVTYLFGVFFQIDAALQLPAIAQSLLRFGFNFLLGAWFYQNRDFIKLKGLYVLLLLVCCFAVRQTPAFALISSITLAYTILWFASIPSKTLLKFNNIGDYSYGIYIYHFPITQALVASMPGIELTMLIPMAAISSLTMAVFSWHFVESPALRAYPRIAGYFHSKLQQMRPVKLSTAESQ